ncbi:arginine N-succinyltransferase [Zooshikella sp. RANM57]|uniref:arginine N-succinyltransferase n=1 Tax=Zooshikella sp. RANM57 TaxID=3425863 RepID=UPI003D6FDA06
MLQVRPIHHNDLPALERLAVLSRGRLTTLPAHRDHLSSIISATQRALQNPAPELAGNSYHFVLENTENKQIIGVAGIESAVGINCPFYSYRLSEIVHASAELQIHNRIPALHLCQDYAGSSRLCTFFIDPEYLSNTTRQLLLKARLLFMGIHRNRFADRTIAELQGVLDNHQLSPFWECLGRHFFSMDISKAVFLVGINSKAFIASMMPQYPVYVPLLSPEAQAVLGQPRADMQTHMALLQAEHFCYRHYLDIFDAGPTLEVETDQVETIRRLKSITIKKITTTPTENPALPLCLLSTGELKNFRCILRRADPENLQLSCEEAECLGTAENDQIQCVTL